MKMYLFHITYMLYVFFCCVSFLYQPALWLITSPSTQLIYLLFLLLLLLLLKKYNEGTRKETFGPGKEVKICFWLLENLLGCHSSLLLYSNIFFVCLLISSIILHTNSISNINKITYLRYIIYILFLNINPFFNQTKCL